MNAEFSYRGERHLYFDHPYNDTRLNERCVELAIVRVWLQRPDVAVRDGKFVAGLEVGNVLQHYACPFERRVIDLHETADDVENVDVLSIEGSFPWIVSISTIEHVGVDDGTDRPKAALDALAHLRAQLEPGGRMLVTAALGWNVELDGALLSGDVDADLSSTMVRDVDGDTLDWVWKPGVQFREYRSVDPGWAAAVWIGEWRA